MAEMNTSLITNKGMALMAKLIAGTATTNFTRIVLSSRVYTNQSESQLRALTSLAEVKQTTLVSRTVRTTNTTVRVEGAVNNDDLSTGYLVNTIGVYATDPDEGEILYSVITADSPDFMPPKGKTSSGIIFGLSTVVTNSANVTISANPAAFATAQDVSRIETMTEDHLDAEMPHKVRDDKNNLTFSVGLEIHEGQPRIIYEEA